MPPSVRLQHQIRRTQWQFHSSSTRKTGVVVDKLMGHASVFIPQCVPPRNAPAQAPLASRGRIISAKPASLPRHTAEPRPPHGTSGFERFSGPEKHQSAGSAVPGKGEVLPTSINAGMLQGMWQGCVKRKGDTDCVQQSSSRIHRYLAQPSSRRVTLSVFPSVAQLCWAAGS